MTTIEIVLGAILIAMAVFLIVAVLMQSGKDKGLSGTISGGAETFFGKSKGKTIDKKLSILTTIVAIVFVLVVLAVYVAQDTDDPNKISSEYTPAVTESAADTSGDSAEPTTAAPTTDAGADTDAEPDTTAAPETEAPTDTAEATDTDNAN